MTSSNSLSDSLQDEKNKPCTAGQTLKVCTSNKNHYHCSNNSQKPHCPYHDAILHMQASGRQPGYGLGVMDRFIDEGPAEQYAVFVRADTGKLSISKQCFCKERKAEKL
jgi:hypothetical protein